MEQVGERLRRLEEQSLLDLSKLAENDEFLDAVLQATRAAVSTHREEKRAALRAAILNTALGRSPDEVVRQMYLGFVDSFTALHLSILGYLHDPPTWYSKQGREPPPLRNINYVDLIADAFPEFHNRTAVAVQILEDLRERSLIREEGLYDRVTYSGDWGPRGMCTELGERFLEFISEPEEAHLE